ncbi:DUF1648 domain-containing protein [Terrisporobacter sp.]
MFFLNYVLFILIILFTHLIALETQKLSNQKYFFGVYINEITLEEDFKNKINKDFKGKVNLNLLLIIMIYLILKNIFNLNVGESIVICITLYITLLFFILKLEYKKVKDMKKSILPKTNINKEEPFKRVIIKEDEVLAVQKEKLIKKFKVLFSICIILSLMSFLYVLINYKNMPDVIITHWGAGGKPDGYSQKNIINVFYINFLDMIMVLLFAIIGVSSVAANTYIDGEDLELNRKKALKYLNGIGYSFFFLTLSIQSVTTTIPIFMVQQRNIPIWLTISSCIVPIFISVPIIYFYIMLTSLKPKSKSVYTVENDDEKWIYGFIYYNKDDSNFVVEKRFGMGWNMNMAHPLGKITTVILILIIFGSLFICFI